MAGRPDGQVHLVRIAAPAGGIECVRARAVAELHAHAEMDKVYHVLEGEGTLLLEGEELPLRQGDLAVAPSGVPHGIRASAGQRLLLLVVLAPGPSAHR